MQPLYSVAEIRDIETRAAGDLMQRAGWQAAQAALALASEGAILVLAGPGNNGGDACEAAAHLADAGRAVSIVQFGDATRYSPDATRALQRARASKAVFVDPACIAQSQWALAIDGLFGIGLTRPIGGDPRAAVEALNRLACPVLALDVPSGLDADTGVIVGPDGVAVRATHTITFIGDKPGLHTGYGRDYAGAVQVASLEIEPVLFPPPCACINEPELWTDRLAPRAQNSHKGSYGNVSIIGGAHGMAGAAILSARAAARCGAGRVFAGFIDEVPAYDTAQPELMCRVAAQLDLSATTVVAGPGMGSSAAALKLLEQVLQAPGPLVLDADALNLLASQPLLHPALSAHGTTILTPHPLEAARLQGVPIAVIQSDRVAAARVLAQRFNAIVVLKGSGSVIAAPDGRCCINPTGNPGLASAGTGDVLAGICGALLAQGWPAWQAALGAAWLHGRAADVLVERGVGPIGLGAMELIPVVRELLNDLVRQHALRPVSH
jgi:hydroxyethylthiazole kinase-like uncharacterized protein yjeF